MVQCQLHASVSQVYGDYEMKHEYCPGRGTDWSRTRSSYLCYVLQLLYHCKCTYYRVHLEQNSKGYMIQTAIQSFHAPPIPYVAIKGHRRSITQAGRDEKGKHCNWAAGLLAAPTTAVRRPSPT